MTEQLKKALYQSMDECEQLKKQLKKCYVKNKITNRKYKEMKEKYQHCLFHGVELHLKTYQRL